jgi:exodeoxyribonuclease VII small subunit
MAKEKEATFEEALKKLEAAVEQLEAGNLPLAEALKLFEEGLKASNACRARLEEARQRVEVLVKESGGEFRLSDLDADNAEDEQA